MNLEDHTGDIVRKGRLASGAAAKVAAQAAGLTEAELGALEESGRVTKAVPWQALGQAIGLNGAKLESIAKGWLPVARDLSQWREFRHITTTANDMAVHCYLIWDEGSRDAALFDTGWDPAPIFRLIDENGLKLQHFFITHTHEDHIAGMGAVRERFPKAHLHTSAKSAPPQHRNRANDFTHVGSLRITNRDTPGHAEDGVTYIVGGWPDDAPHVAIVGDAIFAASMGKGNQSWDLARQKVREQILTLPDETLLCPGHGPLTTVAEEKANNPFF
ncbi:MAG TPA: MBL fold metallo-hydrolase [Verrucomicrobiae bacterium]|jgi:glyoxylase-like metal-dependent hydrolase (beta-lactamase superfamily II)|nr:MBL fold metallo-hydrolase [Verrucomicrobiae bacterium]